MSKKDYYVYEVYVNGVIRYIGSGKGDRFLHPTSGKSSCVELNRDHFEGQLIEVAMFKESLTKEDSLYFESKRIRGVGTDNLYNKVVPRSLDLDVKGVNVPICLVSNISVNGIKLNHSVRWLYIYLLSCYRHRKKNKQDFYESQEIIADRLGMSVRSIRDGVSTLKSAGLLEVSTKVRNNVYTIFEIDKIN